MFRPAAILLLLATCAASAALPVSLHDGRIATTQPGAEVMLGEPVFGFEGGSSRATVTVDRDGTSIDFRLDVTNTAYWENLRCTQSDDGGVSIVGWIDDTNGHHLGDDGCEWYPSWPAMLRSHEWLATDFRLCLARAGMSETLTPIENR